MQNAACVHVGTVSKQIHEADRLSLPPSRVLANISIFGK